MFLFDVAAKRVVFGGPVFICRNVDEGAPGCIMLEVDITSVTELVSLMPCSGAGSGTVTSGGAAAVMIMVSEIGLMPKCLDLCWSVSHV